MTYPAGIKVSDDQLAASVFALGLSMGFVRRDDVVRHAERPCLIRS